MPATIKGTYNNGQVILEEVPETSGPVEVLITFAGDVVFGAPADKLNLADRLKELSLLEDGWLNGEGIAPRKADLDWFSNIFETLYDKRLPLPYLYPTINGGVQAEWVNESYDISLTIDFSTKAAFYQYFDHADGNTEEITLDLLKKEDWQLLNTTLLTILKA